MRSNSGGVTRVETSLQRYRWAYEELLIDALYQKLNRLSTPRAQLKYLRRALQSKQKALEIENRADACEDLTLYYFSALRECPLDMVQFLLHHFQCDYTGLAVIVDSLVAVQDGRRKTLGLVEDKKDIKKRGDKARRAKQHKWTLE